MACNLNCSSTSDIVPTFNVPSKLSNLAAKSVIRLLVYEDYEDCNFYRWDPVTIWQFETHQPKKKKSTKKFLVDNALYGHPPPPWKGIKNLRNWWCENSFHLLGHLVESPLRQFVVDGLERQSWTSFSEEEDILFLLLRLCMDTQLHFLTKCINENWYTDLAQIMDNLGPFPLQKLVVGNDVFQGNTLILSTIIQNSPNLQVLRIGQWELSNDILFSLGNNCPLLQEFSIHGMEPDVFMSDEAFFKCFFSGMTPDEVLKCHENNTYPRVSFVHMKYIDMLFCKQTERLILMISYFYSNISLSAFDISTDSNKLLNSFLHMNIKMPFFRLCCNTENILNDRINTYVRNSACLKELRLHVDDKLSGADSECIFNRQLEIASERLRLLIGDNAAIDSLAIKSHQNVDVTRILLPTFGAHGSLLRCLYFVYDYSSVTINTLYQLLNLCPLLEKLIIDISLLAKDRSSKSYSTPLREHPTLETIVLQELEYELEEQEESEEESISAFCILIRDLLTSSPNLKNLAMPLPETFDSSFIQSLQSNSVERLQLKFTNYLYNQWISFLPSFPSLKLLSLQADPQVIWSECLETLCRKGINITKKPQEFSNVFRWCEKDMNTSQSVFIVVA